MKNIFSFFVGHSRERCLTTNPTLRDALPTPSGRTRRLRPPHCYASMLSQSLLLGVIAAIGLFSNSFSGNSKVYPQTPPVNNTEINSYAQAVLAMEPARQHAFEEIKKMIGGGEIPQIVCNDANSISGLPPKAQDIAVNYCTRSQKIVQDNGLSVDRFNKITMEIQYNNNLKRQIYNTLLRLQQTSDPR